MKISYNKRSSRYEAYTYENKKKVSLGYFIHKYEAKERLETVQKALEEGFNLKEWLASHPNKKAFLRSSDMFEEEYNKYLGNEGEPKSKDGFHFKLGFAFTSYQRIQKKYEQELEGNTHIALDSVSYLNFYPDLNLDKKVNFTYWKAHLGKIGKLITYTNLHITEFELKLALLKVFQRNIYIPKVLQPSSDTYCEEWRRIGEELDELVQECIYYYGKPSRKPQLLPKIIFNPKMNLTKDERKQITVDHTSSKRKNGTLEKLMISFQEGISKKKLSRDSGISLTTVKKHWDNLIKQAA